MKKVIYTAVTNGYDDVVTQDVPQGWELKVFTEGDKELDPQRQARKIKICPHLYFDYDVCVWFDGNLKLDKKAFEQTADFVTLQHPQRNCVYDEADTVKLLSKADPMLVDAQILTYEQNGMPKNHGMIASGYIFRKNTKEVRGFCEAWWKELERFTARDQLSFNYIAWKKDFPYRALPFNSIIKEKYEHKDRRNKRIHQEARVYQIS